MKMKKFLDQTGISVIWSKIENNYPTNEDLTNVINAIDETKADKDELVGQKKSKGEIFNDYVNNTAQGNYSHAEGQFSHADGNYSHAEGYSSDASGDYSHAEGYEAIASGDYSHAEGYYSEASGDYSHVEGCDTVASGNYSHAEGCGAVARSEYQHVQGKYNIGDTENKYAHIVGNGTKPQIRSNAHTLDWEGNVWFAGDIKIGGTNYDEGFSVPYVVNPITIPAGRMYGDLDGDGFIDDNDVELFKDVYNNTENYTGTEEVFLLSDFNKSGTIQPVDFLTFKNVHKGFYGHGGNDYTGNYIANPNYRTEEAQFYTDISLPSLTTSQDVMIAITSPDVDASIFVKGEVMEGILRIWVKRPPISNIECLVTVVNNGSGKCSIVGGDVSVYVDYIKSTVDADIVELKKTEKKKYSIPAGRMYGDINGDGFIDEVDRELIVEYFNMTTEDYEEVPLDFYLSDITHDGVVDYDDFTPYSLIINNGKGYGITGNDYTGNYIANPNYSTEKAQFCTDVTVADITSTCNVSVEIATYDVDSSIFVKAEPIDGAVRIWVTRPPISAVDCLISFNEGEGIGTISGGDSTIYVDNMSYEKTKNKATEINEDSTDEQYPSAKAVYTSLLENKPYMTKITLTTSGWDVTTLTQIATIEGIKADETAQAIYINPTNDATIIDMIANCNVRASAQGENSLTFSCDTVPSQDLEFYVKWEDVKYIS